MRKEFALLAAVAAVFAFMTFGAKAMPAASLKAVTASADQVIHVWTAPVGQELFDSVLRNGSGHSCVRPVARGLRPLAMMVSVDRVLIKLPRF